MMFILKKFIAGFMLPPGIFVVVTFPLKTVPLQT